MPTRVARFAFGPLSHLVTRVGREVKLWRWRRERSQIGAPVTIPRRGSGRSFTFESRRSGSGPGL